MRRRLLSGLLAACLAASIAVGGPAKPAKAVDASFWINVAVAVALPVFNTVRPYVEQTLPRLRQIRAGV